MQNLKFDLISFVFFPSVSLARGDTSIKILLRAGSASSLSVFSRSFVVSGLTLKSLIYFELILVCDVGSWRR